MVLSFPPPFFFIKGRWLWFHKKILIIIIYMMMTYDDVFGGALAREARSGAPWLKKCCKLPIRENLVIT